MNPRDTSKWHLVAPNAGSPHSRPEIPSLVLKTFTRPQVNLQGLGPTDPTVHRMGTACAALGTGRSEKHAVRSQIQRKGENLLTTLSLDQMRAAQPYFNPDTICNLKPEVRLRIISLDVAFCNSALNSTTRGPGIERRHRGGRCHGSRRLEPEGVQDLSGLTGSVSQCSTPANSRTLPWAPPGLLRLLPNFASNGS